MRNIKLALRMLVKTPFVTAVAVLSLALGIGSNAAIYSLFEQLLLRSLPVLEPGQLVNISAPGPTPGSTSCNQQGGCDIIFSYPMFRDLEKTQTALAGIAASRIYGAAYSIDNEPGVGDGVHVSGGFFSTLGVQPHIGRLIGPADDEVIGAHDVVVLSYDFWADRFGGRQDAVGKTLRVSGRTMEIIGVTAKGFTGATAGSRPVLYTPLAMRWEYGSPTYRGYENRRDYFLYVFGRLKEGGSMAQAKAGLDAVYRPIINDVEAPLQVGMSDQTLERFRAKEIVLEPGRRGQSDIHEEATTPLLMLFSITAVVLLIACANIANLLLARGAGRATEMGVRLALGASRRHLLAQLLTESVLLALAGGAVSLLVAQWTLDAIASFLPPDATQSIVFSIQPSVLIFAGVLAVTTGLIFGMFPALHSTRPDLIQAIRAGAGQIAGGRAAARFRSGLVTAQIALSMGLLISAGLFLKSLVNVSRIDIGIDVDQVVTFSVSPTRIGYDSLRSSVLLNRITDELGALPGVTGVTSSMVPLLAGNNWGNNVLVEGFECGPDTDCNSSFTEVGPDFFSVLDLELIAGRGILASDIDGATRVAVVNEAFAEKFNLGRDAVGKYMARGGTQGDSLTILIVGLARNIGYSDVKDPVPPVFYLPWRQNRRSSYMNYYVKTALPPEQLLTPIPALMKRLDPTLPIEELKTMPQQIRENIFLDRMISILSAAFAVLATLLAGVGLYGVLSYSVAQRTREIGVRMALGAHAGSVLRLVLRQVGLMLLIGGVVGIGGALAAGRAARSLLYQLEGNDPLVFTAAVLLLSAVALVAGFLPARRASQTDPMHALRYD